ncbi:hypothetical protein Sjap_006048 [Stephania japonica]|uniref:Uncharacterized protein n=1 Tax=Stephania japonica TaxID=461633 RepID=A0AAP0K7Q4_9MAGN
MLLLLDNEREHVCRHSSKGDQCVQACSLSSSLDRLIGNACDRERDLVTIPHFNLLFK